MNAVVNGRFLSHQVTGVQRYGQEILRCIGDKLRVVRPKNAMIGIRGHGWEQFILPRMIRPGEILWSPANAGPLAVVNQVLTIHDLSPLEHPEWFKPAFSLWYRLLWPLLVRRVKRILTLSEYVREKVIARFSLRAEQVVAVPGGVDRTRFCPSEISPGNYVLFVGSLEPRKNLFGLLRAWELVKDKQPDFSLVIAGASGNVFQPVAWPSKTERVHWIGYVPEADLHTLYARAALFILPSFDEGFGLTLLEAMACGTPVAAANAGALPEVVGDAGLFFDPANWSEMATTIERALTDQPLRQILREKGLGRAEKFSWPNSAERIWQVLQECQ